MQCSVSHLMRLLLLLVLILAPKIHLIIRSYLSSSVLGELLWARLYVVRIAQVQKPILYLFKQIIGYVRIKDLHSIGNNTHYLYTCICVSVLVFQNQYFLNVIKNSRLGIALIHREFMCILINASTNIIEYRIRKGNQTSWIAHIIRIAVNTIII